MIVFASNENRELFVIGQVRIAEVLELGVTAYSLAKWLKCSPPTARKILNKLEGDEKLYFEIIPRGNTQKHVFKVTDTGLSYFEENYDTYIKMLHLMY